MAGGILLAGIISMSVLTNSQSQSSPMQRLPDGSWLKIVSISYAPAYSYDMPRPKLWQSFLLKHLPSSYSAHLGLWHGTGRVGGSSARAGETNLAVITVCKQATPTSLCSSAQMDVFDERTRKVGTAFAGATAANSDGTHQLRLVCWVLDSNVPHDTKRLILRFSELAADGMTRQQVAEFVIPNPAAGEKKHD